MVLDSCMLNRVLRKTGFDGSRISSIGAGLYNDSYTIDSDKGRFVLRIALPDNTKGA